jgi:hypothetical protein
MRPSKVRSIRNTLDIADANQVRAMKKRCRLSDAELAEIVDKIGNSIAAIGKEAAAAASGAAIRVTKRPKWPQSLHPFLSKSLLTWCREGAN